MESIGQYLYDNKPIGRGSFSVVFKGYDKNTYEEVAIKKMELDAVDQNLKEHIKSEIKLMKKLKQPNIITLKHVLYNTQGAVHIIMEYCS